MPIDAAKNLNDGKRPDHQLNQTPTTMKSRFLNHLTPLACIALTSAFLSAPTQAQDVSVFYISKGVDYTQSSASTPSTPNGYFFNAEVIAGSPGSVTAADLQLGPGAPLQALGQDGDNFCLEDDFTTKTALDMNYPNSAAYEVGIDGANDASVDIALSFGSSDNYPNAPHIQNYTALQSIDPTQPLTLTWAAFTGGTTDDLIQILVERDLGMDMFEDFYESPGPGEMGALDGTDNSVTIPANTLPAGATLSIEISFSRVVDFQFYDAQTYPDGPGGAAVFTSVTTLQIHTQSAGSAPDASLIAITKTQRFQQDEAGIPVLVEDQDGDSGRFKFEVYVEGSTQGAVTSSSVTLPGGAMQSLTADNNDFIFESVSSEKPEMDTMFPAGTYTVAVNTANDGARNVTLTVPADNYPNIPTISNWSAAQSIDSTTPFILNFETFAGGTAGDFVMLEIEPSSSTGGPQVYESPGPGETGSLDGTDTFATIPANTLSPGLSYMAKLSFFRIVGSDTSYTTGLVAFHKETHFEIRTSGGSDTEGPNLVRVEPSWSTSQVKDISTIMFEFSEPMDTTVDLSQALQWSGVADADNFSYTWADNDTRLFCRYTPSLPLDTTINWTLNPFVGLDNASATASPVKQRVSKAITTRLQDAAGNPLQHTPQAGSFSVAPSSSASEKDVLWFQMIKAEIFQQDNATPVPLEEFIYNFVAELNGFNTVLSAEITPPGGSPITFFSEGHGDSLEVEAEYAEKTDLDTHVPNGTFGVRFNAFRDGTQTIDLAMPTDAYPNTPTLQNLASLASVDPTLPLTLTWDAFSNPGQNDAIIIFMENDFGRNIFETPEAVEPGFIPASQNSFTIPANTLPPGRTFEAELAFIKAVDVDDTSYAGVTGMAAFAKATLFEITTSGDPIRADLDMVSGSQSSFQFRVLGEKKMTYTIESSTDFQNWSFENVFNADDNINGPLGEFIYTHFPQHGTMFKYFRTREGYHYNPGF